MDKVRNFPQKIPLPQATPYFYLRQAVTDIINIFKPSKENIPKLAYWDQATNAFIHIAQILKRAVPPPSPLISTMQDDTTAPMVNPSTAPIQDSATEIKVNPRTTPAQDDATEPRVNPAITLTLLLYRNTDNNLQSLTPLNTIIKHNNDLAKQFIPSL